MTKKMITGVALVAALFAFSSTYAQMDTAAMRQRQEARLTKMTADLKLTAVQADSMKAINTEFGAKRRDIFMDQSMSREDKMAKMQPITDAMNARIQAALGPDLFKKYQDWSEANRPQRGGGGGGGNR